ncbi:GyrI-like domain-containing protein [Maribacter algicola]|uniref:GyrI-like domain-containing protein n=1 Tax=Meishania litoralis TaxID=3434685 RepID=A0ACC7LNG8_9FLAO
MKTNIADFKIIGISTRTTNENGESAKVLGELWGTFYSERISAKIPNKDSDEIYAMYTDYESDYTGKYTAIIGHKVKSLQVVPDGLIGREFKGGKYTKLVAKGEMPEAIVNLWEKVWEEDQKLMRRYTVDFEIYGAKSQNGTESEVEVFLATE